MTDKKRTKLEAIKTWLTKTRQGRRAIDGAVDLTCLLILVACCPTFTGYFTAWMLFLAHGIWNYHDGRTRVSLAPNLALVDRYAADDKKLRELLSACLAEVTVEPRAAVEQKVDVSSN